MDHMCLYMHMHVHADVERKSGCNVYISVLCIYIQEEIVSFKNKQNVGLTKIKEREQDLLKKKRNTTDHHLELTHLGVPLTFFFKCVHFT